MDEIYESVTKSSETEVDITVYTLFRHAGSFMMVGRQADLLY
jgi:hypothetical protein